MKNTNQEAVIYVRTSTRQVTNEADSVAGQLTTCSNYCLDNNLKTIAVFIDQASGLQPYAERNLNQAIDKCIETGASLVVSNLSRITRSREEWGNINRLLKGAGTKIIQAISGAQNELRERMLAGISAYDSNIHSEKIKLGIRLSKERKLAGLSGTTKKKRKMNQRRIKGTYISYVKGRKGVYEITSTLPKSGKVINSKRLK
jgi:DNA invertase Pin-like site-specific DNA recombinase